MKKPSSSWLMKPLNDTLLEGNAGSSKIQRQLKSENIVENGSRTVFFHLFVWKTGHLVVQI